MNQPLREEIERYVESAYFHGLPVKNLDTGEVESPKSLEDTKWIVDRLEALLLRAIRKARIEGELAGRSDELVKLSEWGKTIDDQWNKHFEERLTSLRSSDE